MISDTIMSDQPSTIDIEKILAECDPYIRKRIRKKLDVSLREADVSMKNQDALDTVYGGALLEFIADLTGIQRGLTGKVIRDYPAYALSITKHKIAEYLNDRNPNRRILKDKLQYCLETRQRYALWKGEDSRLLCGLARWQFQDKATMQAGNAAELRNTPELIDRAALPDKYLSNVEPDDWLLYLDAVFTRAAAPMAFDDLVYITARLLGIRDEFQQMDAGDDQDGDDEILPEPADDKSLGQLDKVLIEECLRHLWTAIVELSPLMRAVVLLNVGAVGKKTTLQTLTEIGLFPLYNIASKDEIGRLLNISDDQFNRLWNDLLEMEEETRQKARALQTYEHKFALLWEYLPLPDDQVIGVCLGVKAGAVSTARFRAVNDRLRPKMKLLGYEF